MLDALLSAEFWRARAWTVGLVLVSLPILWKTVRGVLRGKFAADVVASLAIITSILIGQPLVGFVIVLMQTGGEALERYAAGRASQALRQLTENAPHVVHLVEPSGTHDVRPDSVRKGDSILVRPGEMIPCDGIVIGGESHVDTSTLTGEPMPQRVTVDDAVMSGATNEESPLTIRVTAIVEDSQYARIVALVREAQSSKAPLQRLADRYAVWFTPFTIAVCGFAWILSGDWQRVLAVLAIATPCPLILATPVAILGGMNRAARRHILVRNGGALETLSRTSAIVFDKTGTLTAGKPSVSQVVGLDSLEENEVLRLASAVEQGSGHLLARTVVEAAEALGMRPPPASEIIESPGRGVEGKTDGMRVAVGAGSYIAQHYPALAGSIDMVNARDVDVLLRAFVAVDGKLAGSIEYEDQPRPSMNPFIERLRSFGIERLILLSGDRPENARRIAAGVGIQEARGDMLPQDKVDVVNRLKDDGEVVAMIGDGTNDAPALSAADVGIALASHGRGVATEAADVILLIDDPARLADAITISRRTMRIARQSIWTGLGLSAIGMTIASLGGISAIAGAAVQEIVDLAVIVNALRASRDTT